MSDDSIQVNREVIKIEGDRNLYNYTFTDLTGRALEPQTTLPAPVDPGGDSQGAGTEGSTR
jgi:hypothetical protein